MSVLCVLLFFLITPSNNREVKVVFIDGSLTEGVTRSIRGRIVDESEKTITIERSNGNLTIGKNFIVKIEDWHNHRGRENFDY
jgi:RNase P/RNase MRP subunit p29